MSISVSTKRNVNLTRCILIQHITTNPGKELWTIRTLANSALVNSDLKKFDPSLFGPQPRVNSDPDYWSIRTFLIGQFGPQKERILWSVWTFSLGQFGPFPLVNSDLFLWLIRTFSIGQFGPFQYVFSRKEKQMVQIKNEPS